MTLDELRDAAAQMLGFPNYASARPDQSWIARAVVRAIYKAYQPDDGSRAVWAEKAIGLYLPAPVSVTINVTQGSDVFTHSNDIPAEMYRGSYVLIDDRFYTYADRTDGTNGKLVEPYEGTSGSVVAKFYHNSVELDSAVFSVMARPQLVGYGNLVEISSKRKELGLRDIIRDDYLPLHGSAYYNVRVAYDSMNTGTPRVYFIDDTMMDTDFGSRMVVHPLPDKQFSISARASMAPSIPVSGTVPFPGPDEFSEVILIPILEKICSSSKRYAGKNQRELAEEEAEAFALLRRFSRKQKRQPMRVRLRCGY